MTIGSLFSGIGGLELGLERAGLGPVIWQAETDPYCRKVLEKHWPEVPRYDDVTLMVEGEGMAGKLKKLTIEQAAESVRMYDAGLSLADVAVYFGVSRSSMHDLLKRRTKMRPQKRYGSENHFYRGGDRADDPAQNIAEKAVARGALVRPERCSECDNTGPEYRDGRASIQAHHDDYNKPLNVRWLCKPCHHDWHKHNKAVRKEVSPEVPSVDILCGGFP